MGPGCSRPASVVSVTVISPSVPGSGSPSAQARGWLTGAAAAWATLARCPGARRTRVCRPPGGSPVRKAISPTDVAGRKEVGGRHALADGGRKLRLFLLAFTAEQDALEFAFAGQGRDFSRRPDNCRRVGFDPLNEVPRHGRVQGIGADDHVDGSAGAAEKRSRWASRVAAAYHGDRTGAAGLGLGLGYCVVHAGALKLGEAVQRKPVVPCACRRYNRLLPQRPSRLRT